MIGAIPKVRFMGIDISVADPTRLLDFVVRRARRQEKALVNNVNIHAMNVANADPLFASILNNSDVVFCDGYGVKLAALLSGVKLGERMTPPDWIDPLFEACERHSLSLYVLGDEPTVAKRFVDESSRRFPSLVVAGYHHGFFDLESEENDRVVQEISDSSADIVLAGMGMPRQEMWGFKAKSRLSKGVIIAVGALFRWYTGTSRRSPKWMTDHGLEWLGRLVQEPERVWKRYLAGNPAFFLRVLKANITARRSRQADGQSNARERSSLETPDIPGSTCKKNGTDGD